MPGTFVTAMSDLQNGETEIWQRSTSKTSGLLMKLRRVLIQPSGSRTYSQLLQHTSVNLHFPSSFEK